MRVWTGDSNHQPKLLLPLLKTTTNSFFRRNSINENLHISILYTRTLFKGPNSHSLIPCFYDSCYCNSVYMFFIHLSIVKKCSIYIWYMYEWWDRRFPDSYHLSKLFYPLLHNFLNPFSVTKSVKENQQISIFKSLPLPPLSRGSCFQVFLFLSNP